MGSLVSTKLIFNENSFRQQLRDRAEGLAIKVCDVIYL